MVNRLTKPWHHPSRLLAQWRKEQDRMVPHFGHFLVMMAIFVVVAVLGRALAPLLRSLGLVIGLIGAVVGVIAATVALGALVYASVAGWMGWNRPSGSFEASGHPGPFHFAIPVLAGVALGGAA